MGGNINIGNKTARLHFFTTKRFKSVYEDHVKKRQKRNPDDPTELINYKNSTDFFVSNMKALFLMPKLNYNYFMMKYNPDHPDFPKEKV